MNIKEAAQLRKEWGDKPCDHLKFVKEAYLGGSTGDYVCTTCGDAIWHTEYEKLMAERKKPKDTQ